jgi:Cd2+/Zn2+-exporting ATPase
VGEFFQDLAVDRSRRSIKNLVNLKAEYAHLNTEEGIKEVRPEAVSIGETIIIKAGEKIPLDGMILDGSARIDTSALTGESMPREVVVGDEVLAGSINQNGHLTLEVTKTFKESTVAKILQLVEGSTRKKAPTENFITRFSRYYTPVVVIIAVGIAIIPPLFSGLWQQWIYRALVFLVVSCPCALVISIPLGFFGGIGSASKRGILVKGGNYLEALDQVDTVVFDKTGTLTKGVFQVEQIVPNNHFTEAELLEWAALAESSSNHPIAQSILKRYAKSVSHEAIDAYEEFAGRGIDVKIEGHVILVGNEKLMVEKDIIFEEPQAGTVVHVAVDGVYAGYILIADEIKEDAIKAITRLKDLGVKRIVMLTGDQLAVGKAVGNKLGIEEVYGSLLPDDKVQHVERLMQEKTSRGRLVFVGDGINDAPVLAQADVGVAMGALGSDAAIEAADVVLMYDEPSKLAEAIEIAKYTKKIVTQNIIFALGVKLIVLILGTLGIALLWEAVFADVGVALLAVLNAMRVLYRQN